MGQIALTQTIVWGPEEINNIYLNNAGGTPIPLVSASSGQALIFQSAIVSLIGGNGYPYYIEGNFYFSLSVNTFPLVPISNKISVQNMFCSSSLINSVAPPIISQFTCANPYPFSISQSNGISLIPALDGGNNPGPYPTLAKGQLSFYITYSLLTI